MSRIFLALWLLTGVITSHAITTVDFLLTDARLGIGQATNRTVFVQPLSLPSTTASSVVIGTRMTFVTSTNGEFFLTNAFAPCLYSVSVQAPPSRQDFTILVTATNLGTIYAADCLVASSTATFPAGTVAWSASVSDNRYARTTNNLASYATLDAVTNIVGNFSNSLGSAAFSNSAAFYPVSNPSNFVSSTVTNGLASVNYVLDQGAAVTNFVTNTVAVSGINITNILLDQGVSITNFSLLIGLSATNYTALQGVSVTNFILSTSNDLATAFGSSANYQPASTRLTNWSLHNTNAFVDTNSFIVFTNLLGSAALKPASFFQVASSVLDDFISLGTNFFYPRSNPSNFVTSSITNELNLGTAAFENITRFQATNVNLTDFGTYDTNYFYPRFNPSNFLTTATLTNVYILNTNGFGTNTYLTNATVNKATFNKGFLAYPSGVDDGTPNNYPHYATSTTWIPATNSLFMGMVSDCFAPMISFYYSGECNASNAILAAEMNTIGTGLNFDFLYGQKAYNPTNRAYEWRKMSPAQFIEVNNLSTDGEVTTATNLVYTAIQSQLGSYYLNSNPSNFVSQTIFATNNPSNIVCTLPSMAFWTNGAEWKCVSGSNWFPTVLP